MNRMLEKALRFADPQRIISIKLIGNKLYGEDKRAVNQLLLDAGIDIIIIIIINFPST
jgi:hypothetical protein